MKRNLVILSAVLAAALFASCASQPETFEQVYTEYRDKVDLDKSQTYTVVAGDTLTQITKAFYGNDKGYYFPMIMAASSDTVTNPDLILPGMVLTIPDFDENMNDPAVRKDMKAAFKKVAAIYAEQGNTFIEAELLKIADSL